MTKIGFQLLNPVNHALDAAASETYRVEPYVVTADVYGEGAYAGRGGWSWYTGSAGWLYRAAVEGILGITRTNGELHISPSLPEDWSGFSVKITLDGKAKDIVVSRKADTAAVSVSVDGKVLSADDRVIPFD